jgi:ABC-2 type transport system permease protein
VNWAHFRTFVWLRWRLFLNQMRRGGLANIVVLAILSVAGAVVAVVMGVALFLAGLFGFAGAPPVAFLLTWDGLVVPFLFFWATGLLVELQRSEALSLDRFLHLPVSLTSAFLINYLSSWVNLCMIFFLPAMLGLAVGLVLSRGPMMLLLLPLLAALLLAVTALTYQFQGWLAALMSNPRRRRNVIVLATIAIILLAQLPNLVNVLRPWDRPPKTDTAAYLRERHDELLRDLQAGKITPAEYDRREKEVVRELQAQTTEQDRQQLEQVQRTAYILNVALPPGWLPLGAMGLAEGNPLPALLGTLGLGLIGSVSLWRSYRTTVRLYTGQITAKRKPAAAPAAAPAPAAPKPAGPPAELLVEKRLPGLSEQAAAIALAGFRGLVRAPEAKMLLLSPVILLVVFGSMFLTRPTAPSEGVRPLYATGAIGMVLLSMGQLLGNQFGFDRSGFRVFVLCSAPRSDILLGKNLSFAPLALGLSAAALVFLQVVYPMRVEHFLAAWPQAVSMFLLYCLVANWLSILAPMPVASGTMKPMNPKFIPVLLHLAFTFLLPAVLAPTLVPLGVEYLLESSGRLTGLPVALVLSVVVCAGVVVLYRLALTAQGHALQAREQRILETVASKAE